MVVLQPFTSIPPDLLYSINRVCWEQVLEHLIADKHVGMCAIILTMKSTKQVSHHTAYNMTRVLNAISDTDSHWWAPMDMSSRIEWVENLLTFYDDNNPKYQGIQPRH